jgi:hypothetical protein
MSRRRRLSVAKRTSLSRRRAMRKQSSGRLRKSAPWQTQPLQRRKRPGMSSTHGPPKCSCARRPRASSVSSFPRSARPWCQVNPSWTLIPDHVLWFGFNLREDAWGDLSVGSRVTARLPGALEPATATISELRNWGEFAAWRAARASGDHDLNMFFLRLDPVTPSPTVTAGQTIWLSPSERAR